MFSCIRQRKDPYHDGPLGHSMLDLALFDQVLLLERLNCVDLSSRSQLAEDDFPIGTCAHHL